MTVEPSSMSWSLTPTCPRQIKGLPVTVNVKERIAAGGAASTNSCQRLPATGDRVRFNACRANGQCVANAWQEDQRRPSAINALIAFSQVSGTMSTSTVHSH